MNYQAWGGALAPEGGSGTMPRLPAADLASGVTAAFGICAALLGRASSGVGAYLDVSMTDVMSTWTGRTGASDGRGVRGSPSESQPVPGYGLFATADDRQVSLGVVNEQHFWTRLCHELGLDELADLDFDTRSGRGAELQKEVASAIAGRERDSLVTALAEAGVPVAPVLRPQRDGGHGTVPAVSRSASACPNGPEPSRPSTNTKDRGFTHDRDGRPPRGEPAPMPAPRAIRAEPRRRLAVVTCMDARIDVYGLFGLDLGEAHVIRNAGGRVTDDVLRSLALSTALLGVDTVVLLQHTGCGLEGVTEAELAGPHRGRSDLLAIDDHAEALEQDIARLAATPYLAGLQLIVGLLYDLESSDVRELSRWERPA